MADEEDEAIPKRPMFVVGAGGFVGSAVAKAFASVEDEEGWEVTGTVREHTLKPKWVSHVAEPTEAALREAIKRSSVIVLDLLGEPALSEQVLQLLGAGGGEGEGEEGGAEEKTVVGLSTIMTWARTSPPEAEEEGGEAPPLTEEEYKRRRPHVNFREQHTLEKLLTRSKTATVRTAVVCAGLVYGGAQELFHDLFKAAWHNRPLPLLSLSGAGANVLPTIHIADLCSVVLKVAAGEGPAYVVAVDSAHEQTLAKVTGAIARHLGTGEVAPVTRDDVMLHKDVDYFQLHLRISPAAVLEMGMDWVSQGGLAKGAPKVVAEFRKARSLQPLKLLLLGPLAGVPGCLESELAATIAREYGVVHVSAAALVAESLAAESELADRVRAAKAAADKAKAAELPDELMAELVAAKLNSAPCTNQGWVLDGWAQTLARLRLLAPEKEEAGDEAEEAAEEEEGEEGEARPRAPADLTPEHVLVLHMGAEALKGRVQGMGQEEVEASGLTADALLRATQAYAQASAPEGPHNPLMHKALKQLEPLELEQANETAETMLSRARLYLGKPRNYGPTPEETAARAQRQATLRAEAQTQAAKLEAERLEEERAERERLRAAEAARAAERQQHEKALLETRSAPLRAYLMSEVIPTLTEGLIEVTKVRPEDPVDFLAEWIFKNNPVLD